MAEAIGRRKLLLVDKNFQNPVVAEEAEAQVAKIKAVIEQQKRTLSLNAISLRQSGEYSIPAAQDGTVVEVNAMPGDAIAAMGAVVTVDTSNELWVEAQIPASLVALIKPGSALSGRNFTTNAETSACCAGHQEPPRKIAINCYISIVYPAIYFL